MHTHMLNDVVPIGLTKFSTKKHRLPNSVTSGMRNLLSSD